MPQSKSSKRWLKEHFTDKYVKLARQKGYRSRSAYKLLVIQEKDKIIEPGMVVVDLGAAPGGWSEVAAKLVGEKGRIIAVDILPMQQIPGVEFIQGDFTDNKVLEIVLQHLEKKPVDLVISDMSPNISGMKAIDQPRSMYLVELAWDFAQQVLKPGGVFLVKIFQGAGFEVLLKELKQNFTEVKIRKPEASRSRSKEIFLLAKGFRG